MKLYRIYWTLLLISVISSCLLFIIVAAETTHGPLQKHQVKLKDNVTIRDDDLEILGEMDDLGDGNILSEIQNEPSIAPSSETPEAEASQDPSVDILKEGVSQQPNLSQGISETGQSVLVTLVDTASAELQNLAEPHLSSETPPRPPTKNLTLPPDSDTALPIPGAQRPPALLVDNNLTTSENDSSEILVDREDDTPEPAALHPEPAKDEALPEIPATAELDEAAARAKLAADEASATILLEGLVTSASPEPHEDIPSFSEWTQKRLEEAEKKKSHPNASIQTPGGPGRTPNNMKVRSKNYASPDCGAKIVAVNPEARSARSVLASTRDEYMLNTCTSRVWFVVELCEAIQAKKIELANFELFSSSPKDFSVFVSDRFPTRDWSPVGQFTAKDERDIQSFNLHPHLFGKFIKVELHSHYGSEHFCPISLFRAYGTSEFEVLETETEIQETEDSDDEDSDDEEVHDNESGDTSRSVFGSARDVVIRIVQKAAEVLVKSGDLARANKTDSRDKVTLDVFPHCITPRYTIICENCSDDKFGSVYQLLSCRMSQLDAVLRVSPINRTLKNTDICKYYGVDEVKRKKTVTSSKNIQSPLTSLFPADYIIALCNMLAIEERRSAVNNSATLSVNASESTVHDSLKVNLAKEVVAPPQVTVSCVQDADGGCRSTTTATKRRLDQTQKDEDLVRDTKIPVDVQMTTEPTLTHQIKPTKTLHRDDQKRDTSVPVLEPSKEAPEETVQAEAVTTPSPPVNSATATLKVNEESTSVAQVEVTAQTILSQPLNTETQEVGSGEVGASKVEQDAQKMEPPRVEDVEKFRESEEIKLTPQDQLNLDKLLSDLESDSPSNSATITQPTASSTPQQKESVFLRLSNRIKALERNMSLSSQYLEELSRRYKKQVEEMQRSLERATAAMGEEFKKTEERELKRQEEISALREEVTSLTESLELMLYDHNSWRSKLSTFGQHIILIFVELVILVLIISYCRRSSDLDEDVPTRVPAQKAEMTRRKSAESMSPGGTKKKRRPSEIASKIVGSYHGLMIEDSKKERKRKRKREALRMSTRRASSTECPSLLEPPVDRRRPDSAPDSYEWRFDDESRINGVAQNRIVIEEIDGKDPKDCGDSPSPRGINILKSRLSSPSFIKTALKSRAQRIETSSPLLKTDQWEWGSRSSRSDQDSPTNHCDSPNGGSANGHHLASDDSGSGTNTPTPKKKTSGLRRIVKKFF